MNDAMKLALSKFLKDAVDEPLAPGIHPVNGTIVLKLEGNVQKLEDVEYTPTADIPLLATLALVLEKAGFQRENMKNMLSEAMLEAIALEEKGEEHVKARCKDVNAAMIHVRQLTGNLPKKVKSGATKVTVAVEQLVLQPA